MSARTARCETLLMPGTSHSNDFFPCVGLMFLAGYILAAICQNHDAVATVRGQLFGTELLRPPPGVAALGESRPEDPAGLNVVRVRDQRRSDQDGGASTVGVL